MHAFTEAGKPLEVLKGIDLSIHKKEKIAVIGASGSGKSTLLYLLGGLDRIMGNGKVYVAGKDITQMGAKKLGMLRNQHLGFVYQFHHLLPEFTALENVAMPLFIRGVDKSVAKQKAVSILERVGLEHRTTHKPGELSGGERQRTAIARALVTEPSCLLADEPTGNLDNRTAMQVYELLLELNNALGIALVLVTHDEHLASKMERVYRLEDGLLHIHETP